MMKNRTRKRMERMQRFTIVQFLETASNRCLTLLFFLLLCRESFRLQHGNDRDRWTPGSLVVTSLSIKVELFTTCTLLLMQMLMQEQPSPWLPNVSTMGAPRLVRLMMTRSSSMAVVVGKTWSLSGERRDGKSSSLAIYYSNNVCLHLECF